MFDGKEADSLGFWIREIEIALSAGQIRDARSQEAFALSNLGGRARAWAMAKETSTPGYFVSWKFMAQEMHTTFLIANVAYFSTTKYQYSVLEGRHVSFVPR